MDLAPLGKQPALFDIDDPASPDYPYRHGGSFVTGVLGALGSAVSLPGDVATGKTDPYSDDGIGRAQDLAGMAMLGGVGGAPVRAGETALGSGPIRAYHGSPYDFDAFSLDHIGRGEGAQAYGHGLYFAENEKVAKSYRDVLSADKPRQVEIYGDRYIPDELSGAERLAARAATTYSAPLGWKQFIRGNARDDTEALEAMKHLRSGAIRPAEPGRMYEVAIDADPTKMLDWNTPLNAQGEVGQTVNSIIGGNPRQTGGQAYLGTQGSWHPAALSEKLSEAGIPGIKYLDQGSRDVGAGSSNYVIFNDELIDILRKYGLAGLAAIPPAASAFQGQDTNP